MNAVLIFLILMVAIQKQISNSVIQLHVHSWCPPCKKVIAIFQKLQKMYPTISFLTHKYTNKTLIFRKNTNESLAYPTIIFNCGDNKFSYQNDLTILELSYWVQVVCLKKIPTCNEKINDELYHILMETADSHQPELIKEMLKYPHIKVCSSRKSNITSSNVIQILRRTETKTLYYDYFSNNIRNYLIQSQKLAVVIISLQKNTSKVNSFMQNYISLDNFMNDQIQNKSASIYRYQLPQKYKQSLVFFELCYNKNISKCLYRNQRKNQVQSNQKMIEKILHFYDITPQNMMGFEQIIAFRFNRPQFEKYIYHNFGILDEKFMFWINQILSKITQKNNQQKQCYWNAITHRVSESSLQDLETYLILQKFLQNRSKNKNIKQFSLNKIIKNYQFDSKLTLCFQGKKPINYQTNKEIYTALNLIRSFDQNPSLDQL